MSELDYTRKDTLDVALFMAHNPLVCGADGIDPILQAIDAHAGGLKPDQIAGKTIVPYSHAALKRRVGQQRSSSKVMLDVIRSEAPEVLYEMSFVQDEPINFWLRIVIPFPYFASPEHAEARSQALIELVRALAEACPATYGYAHSKGDLALGSDPHTSDPFAPKEVYESYWLNLYGVEMVQKIGRERVLATPVAHLEELSDGSVLLLTRPTAGDYASDEARAAQARDPRPHR